MYQKLFCLAVLAGFVGAQVTGCAVPNMTHLPGCIMLDVGHEGWVVAHDGKVVATKTGKGTQESILGWITSGDASIEAARKAGELTRISHIDYHSKHILGIIGECSTIAYGE